MGHIEIKAVVCSFCSGTQYVYSRHVCLYQVVVAKYIGVQVDRA